ncbi:hypothetical protein H5410_006611 [Solanum commersonii]|uniref:Uncharacterized protein n=1 Tax=Solanum commersonii TaxID=4109 RepID=A0A9J6AA92_SOLCO|nr:hypothetical protein H5410_006611 [Solanum commersonii]
MVVHPMSGNVNISDQSLVWVPLVAKESQLKEMEAVIVNLFERYFLTCRRCPLEFLFHTFSREKILHSTKTLKCYRIKFCPEII